MEKLDYPKYKKSDIPVEWWWDAATLASWLKAHHLRDLELQIGNPDPANPERTLAKFKQRLWEEFEKRYRFIYDDLIIDS